MDPNQALIDLVDLITNDGTPDEIECQCSEITNWLRRGGFRPRAIEAVAATAPAGYTRCRAGCPLTRREENATAPFKEKVSA